MRWQGWQKKVLPATADVAEVPFLDEFTQRVNHWLEKSGQLATNHFIVTEYATHNDGIGLHSDKANSIYDNSVILVVKTGECGRPFVITENKRLTNEPDQVLFNEVVGPGDAVLMTMKANLATKHGVPLLKEVAGPSGSIVLRSIYERMEWNALDRELTRDAEKASRKRAREEAEA